MLVLGHISQHAGNVTRLGRIGAKAPELVEKELGYQAGRLSQGYWVGLLAAPIRPSHMEFGGLTLRSGGREGLPLSDPAADLKRLKVHDQLAKDVGAAGIDKLRDKLARDPSTLIGPNRIVKFFPVIRHKGVNPAEEYPMGDGSPQFNLTEPHPFYIALQVGPDEIARTADSWSVPVGAAARYDDRAKLARYLADKVVPNNAPRS